MTQLLFLDNTGVSQSDIPEYGNNLSDYLTKVNYWPKNSSFMVFNDASKKYDEFEVNSEGWRRVVIRYKSAENELETPLIRDLEIKLVDTTPPTIFKETFEETTIEVGKSFTDPGFNVQDLAESSWETETSIDISRPQTFDDNATFEELKNGGFWAAEEVTIYYDAVDEFGNQAEQQKLNLTIIDTQPPHVALVTHDALEKFNRTNLKLENSNIAELGSDPSAYSRFDDDVGLRDALSSLASSSIYSDYKFFSDIPYIREDDPMEGGF